MASRRDDPFRYPKYRLARRIKPPVYVRYHSFKPHLRLEFEQKCVYCRRPDSVHPNDVQGFAVEHHRPKRRFPERECDYTNLFYACASCNSYKGEYWPEDEGEPFFPNPCDHVMVEHVCFVDGHVDARSVHGAFMVEALQLDDDDLVGWRRAHIFMIRVLEQEVANLQRLGKKLRKRVAQSGGTIDASDELTAIDDQVAQHLHSLNCYCGTTLGVGDAAATRG